MLLISPVAPAQSYIVQIVVPHALDGPKHGTACDLLSRDLVDDPAGSFGNQGATIIVNDKKHLRCGGVSLSGLNLPCSVEAGDGVNDDTNEREVEVGHPRQTLAVTVARVSVVTGQEVPHQTDALPLDVSVLLGQGVV